MDKRAKVAMLPTNEKAPITLGLNDIMIFDNYFHTAIQNRNENFINQHLYITSDDNIKEGDWLLDIRTNKIAQNGNNSIKIFNDNIKKIIATTDILQILNDYRDDDGSKFYLPQPSTVFIQRYVEYYNKGNQIVDVLVEYEAYMIDGWVPTYNNPDNHNLEQSAELDYRIKVSKDNTITIKKVKDSWTRNEIVEIIKKLYNDTISDESGNIEIITNGYWKSGNKKIPNTTTNINKWIEENIT